MHPVYPSFPRSSICSSLPENNVYSFGPLCNGELKSIRSQYAIDFFNHEVPMESAEVTTVTRLKTVPTCTTNAVHECYWQSMYADSHSDRQHFASSRDMTHSRSDYTGATLNGMIRHPTYLHPFNARALANDVRRLDRVQKRLDNMEKTSNIPPLFNHHIGNHSLSHSNCTGAFPLHTFVSHLLPATSDRFDSIYFSGSSKTTLFSSSGALSFPPNQSRVSAFSSPKHSTELLSQFGVSVPISHQSPCTSEPRCCSPLTSSKTTWSSLPCNIIPDVYRPDVTDACVSPIHSVTTVSDLESILASESISVTSVSTLATSTPIPRPHLNMRHVNVKRYPKYSSRKNSGFERRLRHTGMILDAQVTLRLLRKMLQPFVNQAVNKVLQYYMKEYIDIAVRNIRETLGQDSVTEEDLVKFRRSLMRRVALQYFDRHISPASRHNDHPTAGPDPCDRKLNCCTNAHRPHLPCLQSFPSSGHFISDKKLHLDHADLPSWLSNSCCIPSSQSISVSSPIHSPIHLHTVCSQMTLDTTNKAPVLSTQSIPVPCSSSVIYAQSSVCDHTSGHFTVNSSSLTPVRSPSSASSSSTLGFFRSDGSDQTIPPSPRSTDRDFSAIVRPDKTARKVMRDDGTFSGRPSTRISRRMRKRPLRQWRDARSRSFKSKKSICVLRTSPSKNVQLRTSVADGSVSYDHLVPTTASSQLQCSCTHLPSKVDSIQSLSLPSGMPRLDLVSSTLFTLGSSANTWLGLGAARGRIYTKHPELFRYQCDSDDKSWLCKHHLLTGHGVKAYLMHANQVRHIGHMLGATDLSKLKTFAVPPWILTKIRAVALTDPRYCRATSCSGSALFGQPLVHIEDGLTESSRFQSRHFTLERETSDNRIVSKCPHSSQLSSSSNTATTSQSTAYKISTSLSNSNECVDDPFAVTDTPERTGDAIDWTSFALCPRVGLANTPVLEHIVSTTPTDRRSLQVELGTSSSADFPVVNVHSSCSPNPPVLQRFDRC